MWMEREKAFSLRFLVPVRGCSSREQVRMRRKFRYRGIRLEYRFRSLKHEGSS